MTLSDFSLISLPAATHPPGYSFHKYWARKPHNVVRRVLEACNLQPGDTVLDPCCGSGVPLSEAAALGATCIGYDVNPIAVELSRVTLDPPDPEEYRKAITALLAGMETRFSSIYSLDGKTLRYAVHATVVDCPGCHAKVSADVAPKRGRTYTCPECAQRLYFNLEHLVAWSKYNKRSGSLDQSG